MKPTHFDMSEIDAAIQRARASMQSIAEENTSRGAQARMSMAVDMSFSRQIAVEANRLTPTVFLSDALASACANMILSYAETMHQSEEVSPEFMATIEGQMSKIARFLAQGISGKAESISKTVVRSREGGTA